MHNSPTKIHSLFSHSSSQVNRDAHCLMSTDSTSRSELDKSATNESKSFEVYLDWKKRLLIAMQSLDPLGLLESGIFEQYEQTFKSIQPLPSSKIIEKKKITDKVTDFETVFLTYQLAHHFSVTQLERRSRSCDTKDKKRNMHEDEINNLHFALFNNANTQASQQKYSFVTPQEELNKIKNVRNNLTFEEHIQKLRQEITKKDYENIKLKERLSQIQSQPQRKGMSQSSNESDDHRLQYLLKEKQLNKKLQEAREEIQQLRNMLEKANQQTTRNFVSTSMPAQQKANKDSLSILRDRVENEGKMRRTLQQLWTNELQHECIQ